MRQDSSLQHPVTSLSSSFGGTSLPSTPVELKHSPKSSGRRGRKSVTPVARSPLLRPASDLIFDMDDDLDGSPLVKHVRPERPAAQAKNPWRDVNGKPLKEQPPTFDVESKISSCSRESFCGSQWT